MKQALTRALDKLPEEDAGRDTLAQAMHLEVGDNALGCQALWYRSVKAALRLVLVCVEF